MKSTRRQLRELLAGPRAIRYCGVYDPLTAVLARQAGFAMVGIGGNSLGSRLCTSEPLLSLEDVVRQVRYLTAAVDIPVKVDAGAGFGEPLHVMRTVHELEAVGVAAIHVEDQIFPKRAHYHKNIAHVIDAADMVAKIKAAVRARSDPDFVVVARTDAMLTDGFEEGVRRANLYLEAGADAIFAFPRSLDEVRRAPKEIAGPVAYGISDGNRKGRPVLSANELEDLGYRIISYPTTATMLSAVAMRRAFERLKDEGRPEADPETASRTDALIRDAVRALSERIPSGIHA